MTRLNRQHEPGAFYHVTQRGNHQKVIFSNDENRSYFCLLMQKYFDKYHHRVHAFCLMDNHIHLLIQAGPDPISQAMQIITSTYARYLNKIFRTKGHRFQGRYFMDMIQQDRHLGMIEKIENSKIRTIGSDDFIKMIELKYRQTSIINGVTAEKVFKTTCRAYGYPPGWCTDASKNQLESRIRGVTGYITQNYTNQSLSLLAKITNRSSSAIGRATTKIADELNHNKQLQSEIENIVAYLMN